MRIGYAIKKHTKPLGRNKLVNKWCWDKSLEIQILNCILTPSLHSSKF